MVLWSYRSRFKKVKMKTRKTIKDLPEELLEKVLSNLNATSLAFASCTCRSWRSLCNRILSRPKLLSALSLKYPLEVAFQEVFDNVFTKPIRPHFAIVCVGPLVNLEECHEMGKKMLGKKVPLITCVSNGIAGDDAETNEFMEVRWKEDISQRTPNVLLIVGYLPGLKVGLFTLKREDDEHPRKTVVRRFLTDIKDFAQSASMLNHTSPKGIIMFGDVDSELDYVLEKMDHAFHEDTVIVGNGKGRFLVNCENKPPVLNNAGFSSTLSQLLSILLQNQTGILDSFEAAALVFVKDETHTNGSEEIFFHLALSPGLSRAEAKYRALHVWTSIDGRISRTWLTAKRPGFPEVFYGVIMLGDFEDQLVMQGEDPNGDVYIGVTKRRRSGLGKRQYVSSFSLHEVSSADEEYLYVHGEGIRTGDTFHFYYPNPKLQVASQNHILQDLKSLIHGENQAESNKEVFGVLAFSCIARAYDETTGMRSAFDEEFPNVPICGIFCSGEIACSSIGKIYDNELNCRQSGLHDYCSAYLVMSCNTNSI